MKNAFVVVLICFVLCVQGQNGAKEGIQQIALLQLYIGYLQKGYSIAKNGLNTISNITDGHWKLDIEFFNSLKNVNPAIRRYSKVAAIIDYQLRIIKLCSALRKKTFRGEEAEYINSVIRGLLTECSAMIDLLTTVTVNGKLQLSDDERIRVIDGIYKDVLEQYDFIRGFNNEAGILLLQRQKDEVDVKISKLLNGL